MGAISQNKDEDGRLASKVFLLTFYLLYSKLLHSRFFRNPIDNFENFTAHCWKHIYTVLQNVNYVFISYRFKDPYSEIWDTVYIAICKIPIEHYFLSYIVNSKDILLR